MQCHMIVQQHNYITRNAQAFITMPILGKSHHHHHIHRRHKHHNQTIIITKYQLDSGKSSRTYLILDLNFMTIFLYFLFQYKVLSNGYLMFQTVHQSDP